MTALANSRLGSHPVYYTTSEGRSSAAAPSGCLSSPGDNHGPAYRQHHNWNNYPRNNGRHVDFYEGKQTGIRYMVSFISKAGPHRRR